MNIGIMGIGLMGHAFVERFLSQGFKVRVFNRTYDKIEDLVERGAVPCATPDELIRFSGIIILMAADADAIHKLLPLEGDNTLHGKTVIQMATISPQQSIEISEAVDTCGGRYLEAPVLGSIPEARSGSLIIMAGGDEQLFNEMLQVLMVLGSAPRYVGNTGSAAALKLAMNQLIAALTAGFSLSLGYALKNGVGSGLFMETVRESALYAKTYDKKLRNYLQRDFATANFSTRHLLKDVRLFIEDAKAAGLNTAALEGIESITSEANERNMSLMDYSSIFEVICPET